MIICTIDGSPILDGVRLTAIAAQEFGSNNVSPRFGPTPTGSATSVAVDPQPDPPFSIRQLHNGQLSIDGTLEQDARFAAALRAALPDDHVRIIAIDAAASKYVDLVPGITPAAVRAGWRPVEEGGFE